MSRWRCNIPVKQQWNYCRNSSVSNPYYEEEVISKVEERISGIHKDEIGDEAHLQDPFACHGDNSSHVNDKLVIIWGLVSQTASL